MNRATEGKLLYWRCCKWYADDSPPFSFVTVNISYPQLFVETDDNMATVNDTKPVWMICKDLRHRCKWTQVEFDVSKWLLAKTFRLRNDKMNSIFARWYFLTISVHPKPLKTNQHIFSLQNYSRKPLNANIPIGNASLSGTITFVTIALSWAACLFIIFVIRKKHNALRIKLKSK